MRTVKGLKQKSGGYLLISAVILIVLIGFVAVTITRIVATLGSGTASQAYSAKAFYIADAGLSAAAYRLLTSDLSNRLSCSNITTNFNQTSFADGQFTVTGTPYDKATARLSININAAVTTIPVTTITDYAQAGRIMIGREMINYAGTSTSPAVCGVAPCFTNAARGVGGTQALSHAGNAIVSQYRCELVSEGGVPNLTNPKAKREVKLISTQLPQGWVVGNASGEDLFVKYDGGSWTQAGPYSSVPDVNINAMEVVSYGEAWVVGDSQGGSANIDYWDGAVWNRVSLSGIPNKNLYGITCLDDGSCWAVGTNRTFIYYNGLNWSNVLPAASVPDKNIYGVSCVAGNDCWAVGDSYDSRVLLIHWDGSAWSRSSPPSQPRKKLNSVSCVTGANFCMAVGSGRSFVKYSGGSWSAANVLTGGPNGIPNTEMNGVSCISPTNCWAAGNNSGGSAVIAHWNGSQWYRATVANGEMDASIPNNKFNGIVCKANDDCLAVGNSLAVAYIDNGVWKGLTPSGINPGHFNAMDYIPEYSPKLQFWEELFQ